ncbi:MAG: 2Fe-2S iron-sulfur cluster binding domain-containing protein [Acidobacteriia bacterium]|nr:2Fe-2S iron-sulfur cluster binding domain-containing protein [Methyloceanibacter sp.]MBX5471652.1 2Fe-2S iron-sulfur cluster binding domain-containing protein [Acetobacteraceae bacterium]MCL6491214.1 2Fe-2S iron-sulfur cluster binding domain-containing protein [Terriglobia bacterium]
MVKITYVHTDGTRETVDAVAGNSVMQTALANGIEGIVAECGGSCMCATCHVYVEPAQLALLPPPHPAEDEMLDTTAAERLPNSRLSCQITVTPELEGLVVYLPPRQI